MIIASVQAFGTDVVVTGVTMPNTIVIHCLALGTDVACVAVAVVVALNFLTR